jgi:hypothetical protein
MAMADRPYAAPEVIDGLMRAVPFWREEIPETAQIEPVARIVRDGSDSIQFRATDGANDGFGFIFELPVEEAQAMYPEFACCRPHHDAAVLRVRRIMAAAFN